MKLFTSLFKKKQIKNPIPNDVMKIIIEYCDDKSLKNLRCSNKSLNSLCDEVYSKKCRETFSEFPEMKDGYSKYRKLLRCAFYMKLSGHFLKDDKQMNIRCYDLDGSLFSIKSLGRLGSKSEIEKFLLNHNIHGIYGIKLNDKFLNMESRNIYISRDIKKVIINNEEAEIKQYTTLEICLNKPRLFQREKIYLI